MIPLNMIKILKKKTIEQLKDEYNFDEIKDAFDEGAVHHQLNFFYGGGNESFVQACNFLCLSEDNMSLCRFYVQIRAKI